MGHAEKQKTDKTVANHLETGGEVAEQKQKKYKLTPVFAVTGLLEKQKTPAGVLFNKSLGKLWDVTDQISLDFIVEIEKRFRRKNKHFGYFSKYSKSIPKELKKYFEAPDASAQKEFVSFSDSIMVSLSTAAEEARGPSMAGGNVVIMHYKTHEEDDLGKLLIVFLDKKGMFDFDDDLRPEKLEPIDTTAIKQAALVDLNLMSVCFPKNDGEAYLRFIEGNSKSEFFKAAIGCDLSADNSTSVDAIQRALEDFIEAKNVDIKIAEELRTGVEDLLLSYSRKTEPLSIGLVQERVDAVLPEGDNSKGVFAAFVNDNEYPVSSWFSPTNYQAKKSGRITLKDDNKSYEAEVNKNSIGSMNSKKPVKVTNDGEYLLFPIDIANKDLILKIAGLKE